MGSDGLSCCVVIPALRPEWAVHVLDDVAGDVQRAVVVDNSGGAVAAVLARRTPWATVVNPGRNLGFGAAVNLAAEQADEDVLVVLNDDVVLRPRFIPALLEPLADPAVGAVAARLLVPHGEAIDSVGLAVDRTLRAHDVRRVENRAPRPRIFGPSGAAAAYRRTAFEAVGGFAEPLFAYWEDADLALRFWAAGIECAYAHDAVAEHARGTALVGRSPAQRELDAYGRGFVLGRYRGWMSSVDRACVPLVDWPSLLRTCVLRADATCLRARHAGYRAGLASTTPPPRAGEGLVTRTVRQTLRGQVRGYRSGAPERRRSPEDDS